MPCHCAFLSEQQFPQIAQTFNKAFADYYLKSTRKAEEWLYNRCVKNAVEFDYSVGAFDGEELVGFTLVGIDEWMGELAAFDAGTGIIPEYRGQRLAQQMFDHAVGKLRERNVKRFLLEVLQVNTPAIKAYEKAGFRKTREFDCFGLERKTFRAVAQPDPTVEIRPVAQRELDTFRGFADWQPSWENSFSGIARIPDEVVINGAFVGDQAVGLLAYYPLLNWIVSLAVKQDFRRRGIATLLMSEFVRNFDRDVPQINLVNVDGSDTALLNFLAKMGFKLFTSQYEMELNLQ